LIMNQNESPFQLKGKNIIVTGASSGIGRQCAINCSRMGANVILFGRNKERLNETMNGLENISSHLFYSVDLLEYERVEEIIKESVQQKGKIHGLVNCAGISTTLPLKMINTQKMDDFFHANVHGSINITKHVAKQASFSEEGGSIIFISSVMGVVGESGKTLYGMTKGALIAASKSLAIELAGRKIRVNSVSPGVVETPLSQKSAYSQNEDSLNKIKSYHPLGFGQTDDVANACVFLLSDAAKWITGTNLIVDGGYSAR
jgi:NAD(P)-dependent dehydrogenase (short-subunit alcohol dehydrogenase family)